MPTLPTDSLIPSPARRALLLTGLLGLGLALLSSPAPLLAAGQPPLPTVRLTVQTPTGKSSVIEAEAAVSPVQKQTGLMGRKALGANAGMVFHFGPPQRQCMWMRNTVIPLTVAFIDETGRILNLEDLHPLDETIRCSAGPAAYALEMPQGWFAQKKVSAGAQVYGLAELESMARQ